MQEEKRRRGRPATGRVRDARLVIRATREEKDFFKAQAAEHHLTLTDYFLMLAKKK
ncbi:toxin-antitoxin system, antitoxin component, ribbon-helix-helix domain protein [Aerococcus christensenii]|uniref:Toxin-antitoxin system, antitoxin component, ribbon-helix-helix domain protein n=1 Tax=Aerococcus christensenii TaxID=87541 RepID=A0A133XV85_9LACT|nr:toxin-antitoxin system, antitoxin component, ribbon-helix-helix domain protein [Aerococcus christensenii]